MRVGTFIGVALVALCVWGCAGSKVNGGGKAPSVRAVTLANEGVEPEMCGKMAKISRVGDVYLGSQPAPADFRELHDRGVKTVINLRRANEEPSIDAAALSQSLGMAYVNPAFSGADELTDGHIDEVRGALNSAEGPVLLYCASSNRTGAMWLAWRVIDGGKDYQTALAEAKQVGLRNEKLESKVAGYIERHGGKVK